MILMTFDSTHKAMAYDRRLKGLFKSTLIPTPVTISASCGISLKVEESFEALIDAIGQDDLSGVYFYDILDMGKKEFKKLVWEN